MNQPSRLRSKFAAARASATLRAPHRTVFGYTDRFVGSGLALAESAEPKVREESRKFEHPDLKVTNKRRPLIGGCLVKRAQSCRDQAIDTFIRFVLRHEAIHQLHEVIEQSKHFSTGY